MALNWGSEHEGSIGFDHRTRESRNLKAIPKVSAFATVVQRIGQRDQAGSSPA